MLSTVSFPVSFAIEVVGGSCRLKFSFFSLFSFGHVFLGKHVPIKSSSPLRTVHTPAFSSAALPPDCHCYRATCLQHFLFFSLLLIY